MKELILGVIGLAGAIMLVGAVANYQKKQAYDQCMTNTVDLRHLKGIGMGTPYYTARVDVISKGCMIMSGHRGGITYSEDSE